MCKSLDFTHHLIFWGKWSCKKCIVLQLKLAFSAASIYVKGLTEEEHTVFSQKMGNWIPYSGSYIMP